jgi:hypothetical protein
MTYFTIGWIALTFIIPFALRKRGIQESQMVATTLGILGTFIGIVYGLLHFDTGNIDDAVPLLLDGLKFAFVTSIAGMGVSLVFGLFPKTFGFTSSEEETNKNKSESELLAEVLAEIKTLNASIAGDNDTTLITQIQKMRTSIVDKQDELKKAFDEFATQMAKNNIEQLIEAINQVMVDFNAKINDQLGQSFKDLSDSVRSLVEWQQNYVTTVQSATEALGAAQESLKNSSESLHTTSDRVSEIAENNKNISELNNELKTVVENLNQMLDATVGFSQNMKTLADGLSGSGDILKTEIKSLVEESIVNMQKHAEDIQKNINAVSDTAMKNMLEKNNETLQNFEEINQKTLQDFGGHLASIAGKLADDFRRVQEALSIK